MRENRTSSPSDAYMPSPYLEGGGILNPPLIPPNIPCNTCRWGLRTWCYDKLDEGCRNYAPGAIIPPPHLTVPPLALVRSGAAVLASSWLDQAESQGHPLVTKVMGDLLLMQGRGNDAAQCYLKVLADLESFLPAERLEIAAFLLGEGYSRPAAWLLTSVSRDTDPDGDLYERALLLKSDADQARGNAAEARLTLQTLVGRRPTPEAIVRLAALHQSLGETIPALEWLDRAADLDPQAPRIHLVRGQIYMAVGRFDAAAGAFRLHAETPNTAEAELMEAVDAIFAASIFGRGQGAPHLQEALAWVLSRLGLIQTQAAEIRRSLASRWLGVTFQGTTSLSPTSALEWVYLGLTAGEPAPLERALEAVNTLTENLRQLYAPPVAAELAEAYGRSGMSTEEERVYQALLQEGNDLQNLSVLTRMALHLALSGRDRGARFCIEQALRRTTSIEEPDLRARVNTALLALKNELFTSTIEGEPHA